MENGPSHVASFAGNTASIDSLDIIFFTPSSLPPSLPSSLPSFLPHLAHALLLLAPPHTSTRYHTLAQDFVDKHGLKMHMVPTLTDHITALVLQHGREVGTESGGASGGDSNGDKNKANVESKANVETTAASVQTVRPTTRAVETKGSDGDDKGIDCDRHRHRHTIRQQGDDAAAAEGEGKRKGRCHMNGDGELIWLKGDVGADLSSTTDQAGAAGAAAAAAATTAPDMATILASISVSSATRAASTVHARAHVARLRRHELRKATDRGDALEVANESLRGALAESTLELRR